MLEQMEAFQAACKRMPKALREYEAFVELKREIDVFLETLPLVQSLAHPCMRSRHWQQLMQVTGRHLPVSSDAFKLHTLLEARLLEWTEDVEDIANAALKELQLEEKLGGITEEWADCQLGFAPFKSRGSIYIIYTMHTHIYVERERACVRACAACVCACVRACVSVCGTLAACACAYACMHMSQARLRSRVARRRS